MMTEGDTSTVGELYLAVQEILRRAEREVQDKDLASKEEAQSVALRQVRNLLNYNKEILGERFL